MSSGSQAPWHRPRADPKDSGPKLPLYDVQDAHVAAQHTIEELYRKDGSKLWRALAAYTALPEVASDAVAEAFAQALRRGVLVHVGAGGVAEVGQELGDRSHQSAEPVDYGEEGRRSG